MLVVSARNPFREYVFLCPLRMSLGVPVNLQCPVVAVACGCSMCVGIIFISYALQVKYRPFLDPNPDAARDARLAAIPGAELVYVRRRGARTTRPPCPCSAPTQCLVW